MALDVWYTLGGLLVLILLSAAMSLSETALTGASAARLSQLAKDENNSRAARLLALIQDRERVIPSLLLGNNLVNVLASSLATSLLLDLFGAAGVVYATVIMTVMIVLFGEIMPKSYALTAPDRAALIFSGLIRFISLLFYPFARAADGVSRFILASLGLELEGRNALVSSIDEIRGAVGLLDRDHQIKDERDMLGGLLDLTEMHVSDVMVHRTNIHFVCADESAEHIVKAILSSPYTRVPVWSGRPENIIGLIHGKDLLRKVMDVDGDAGRIDIREVMTEPWFVPSTTSLDEQLKKFKKRKTHFAFVVDEYGEFMGIVTLEDVIEEIVGEIADEHDDVGYSLTQERDGSVIVEGQMPIRDLNRAMDWDLPDDEANTIAGLLINQAQRIPLPDQTYTFFGYRMVVLSREKNRLTRLKLKKINDVAGDITAGDIP